MSTPAPSSPTKRRVLAPLDVNTASPASRAGLHQPGSKPAAASTSPLKNPIASRPPVAGGQHGSPRKRPFASMADAATSSHQQPQAKKTCTTPEATAEPSAAPIRETTQQEPERPQCEVESRQRSVSPAASSVFDTSGIDMTQVTALTEPDLEGPRPPAQSTAHQTQVSAIPAPPRRVLTRDESTRQKAEIIRLRLSLAAYKLRTGQTDVPLEHLQVRPVSRSLSTPRPAAATTASQAWQAAAARLGSSGGDGGAPASHFPTFRIHPPPPPPQDTPGGLAGGDVETESSKKSEYRSQEGQPSQQSEPAVMPTPGSLATQTMPPHAADGGHQGDDEAQAPDENERGSGTSGDGGLPASQLPRVAALATLQPIRVPSDAGGGDGGLPRSPLRGPAASGLLELRNSSQ